ncbi:uncharacterized protein LOC119103984 [Pollicipes pollicipes]|uniref:uncharacterized protein LOC119103984 n=1 Tax=Pollicipes pollicipes TaxID=41117 RepID=UPI0018854FC1|nr:uncharacterized protein LOC119103984 [Pollicipes pollicipes]
MLVDKNHPGRRPAPMNLTSYNQLMAHAELGRHGPASGGQREMSPGREGAADDGCTLRKAVLWYCKDTLLSRWNWKERYFILTADYLSCFKKAKSQYSDMGAFLFKLPLASLTGIEWQRMRGQAAVAICDPREGRILIRATQDVLDQWYKALKQASESSRERRRYLRLSSTNLSTLGLAAVGGGARPALSDSSPAIDRLCERVEREVWGAGGSAGRLMRRQKSELDAGVVMRRQLHYASQKRLNRHSMMPEIDIYSPGHQVSTDVISRSNIIRRHNDSLDSAGHSPSTTPSKSSVSSSEGSSVQLRGGPGGASLSRGAGIDGSTTGQRTSSVRRRSRGRTPTGVHGDQIRPQSMVCDGSGDSTDVVMRKKDRTTQLRQEYRVQNRRSCDVTLLNRRSAYLAQYEH